MSNLIRLKKDYTIKLSSRITDFLNPDYIFIPIYPGYTLQVKNNDPIKKGQILLKKAEDMFITSPVSGRIVGAKDCLTATGITIKCIVIENDFKENFVKKTTARKKISTLSKAEVINELKEKGITNASNPTIPLSHLFETNKVCKNLVIKGIQDEPYLANHIFLLQNHAEELLETVDALAEIFEIDNIYLALKNNDSENILKYTNYLGTFPNIKLKLIPDKYPIAIDHLLLSYLLLSKEETIIIDIPNMLVIYHALKKQRQVTEKYITISGSGVTNPQIFNVKIGSPIKEVITKFIKFDPEDSVSYYVNGLMTGKELPIDELIVTPDLKGIIIQKPENNITTECINCGACRNICPAKVNPKWIFDHQNEKERIISEQKKCLHCGLCSYICPANIKLSNYLGGD